MGLDKTGALGDGLAVAVDLVHVLQLGAGFDEQVVVNLEAQRAHDVEVELREQIVKRLGALGVKLDKKANRKVRFGASGVISTKDSKIPVVVIPTNEELMIARETVAVLKK